MTSERPQPQTPFEKFASATKRLFAVPKREVKEKVERPRDGDAPKEQPRRD